MRKPIRLANSLIANVHANATSTLVTRLAHARLKAENSFKYRLCTRNFSTRTMEPPFYISASEISLNTSIDSILASRKLSFDVSYFQLINSPTHYCFFCFSLGRSLCIDLYREQHQQTSQHHGEVIFLWTYDWTLIR